MNESTSLYRTFPASPPLARILPAHPLSHLSLSLFATRSLDCPPSYATRPRIRTLRRSFSIPVSIPTYGIPRTTLAVDPDERRDARDRLKRRSIASFAVTRARTRARLKNLMRADLRANNRVTNRASIMTRSDDAILTSRARNYARSFSSLRLLHRGRLVIPAITRPHYPRHFFNRRPAGIR